MSLAFINIPCNATIMIDDNIAYNNVLNHMYHYVITYNDNIYGYLLLAGVQTVVPMLGVRSTELTMTQMLLPLVSKK